MPAFCAIDFGTSNSAIALPAGEGVRLVRTGAGPADHADGGVLCRRGPGRARGAAAPLRPRGGGGLRRRHRRPADALDEEHPRLDAGRQSTDVGARPLGALSRRRRRLPAPPEARGRSRGRARTDAAGAGPAGVLRRRRRASATPTRRRRCCRRRATPASPTSALQYEPIAAALDYETTVQPRATGAGGRHRRRHLGLLAGARRAGAAPAAPSARTTSWPTTACMSPAPTSTATSSWPASCRAAATAASGPRRPRGAEQGVLRPGHLAPDQHRLRARPAWPSWRA